MLCGPQVGVGAAPPKEGEGPCRECPAGDTGEEARSEVAPGREGGRDVGSGEGREVGSAAVETQHH